MAGGSEFFAVFYFLSGSRITQVIVRTIFGVFWNTPSAVELWFPSLPPVLTSSRGPALILCQGSHSNQTHDLSLLAPCPQHRRNQRPDVKSDYTPGGGPELLHNHVLSHQRCLFARSSWILTTDTPKSSILCVREVSPALSNSAKIWTAARQDYRVLYKEKQRWIISVMNME